MLKSVILPTSQPQHVHHAHPEAHRLDVTTPAPCIAPQCVAGKNRPLEPDELEFLDTMAEQEAQQQRQLLQHEAEELAAYRQAVAAAAEAKAAAAAGAPGEFIDLTETPSSLGRSSSEGKEQPAAAAAGASRSSSKVAHKAAAIPLIKPIVKVKPKAGSCGAAGGADPARRVSVLPSSTAVAERGTGVGAAAAKHEHKQYSLEQQQQQQQDLGLSGLLTGYGSGSEEEDS